jgi:glucose/arabinose dehydrogenase
VSKAKSTKVGVRVLVGVLAVAAAGTGVLIAACGGDDTPKPRPLATGVFDCSAPTGEVPDLELREIQGGFTRPLLAVSPPGDKVRLFVLEQRGRILILKDDLLSETPFLDIVSKVQSGGPADNERGLLALAFHPQYETNGRFFIHYSTRATGDLGNGDTVVAEYKVSADDPDVADPTEKVLLTYDQPEVNHNGGSIEFSPKDGFLYIGLGDGGGGGDGHGAIGNGQLLSTLLGKILRIDVDKAGDGKPYAIPPGNMTGTDVAPEIVAYGLRNPWRMTFDPCTGDLFVGDVGQNEIEEIDVVPAGKSGNNYGWRLLEGNNCFNPQNDCDPDNATVRPITQYANPGDGCSVTGGYVYRGSAIPGLRGKYLYADFCTGRFWMLDYANGAASNVVDITSDLNPVPGLNNISSFGQDGSGELYVTTFDGGSVFRIEAE